MSDSASAPKLFISYRRDETPVSAAWLYEVLVQRFGESNVFMDLTLKPGEDFVERITDVLGSCHILLLVMGPRWANPDDGSGPASIRDPDDFVRLEAEVAMARRDVEVLPVLVGGAKMPHRDELPEKIQGLTRIQAKQLTDDRRAADMRELVARVEELLPPETVVRVPDTPPPKEEPPEPKHEGQPRRWIAAAAVAAILVVAVVLAATGGLGGGGGDQSGESGESGTLGASDEPGYPIEQDVGDLDARADLVALTKKQGDSASTLAQLDVTNGEVTDLASGPADYDGMDVGTNERGDAVVVVSRCETKDACDVYRLRGREPVPQRLATSTCKAVRPSMSGGRILFSRTPSTCAEAGLWITSPGTDGEQRIADPGRGADLNGGVAAVVADPRTIAVFAVRDDGVDPAARLEAVGDHSWAPPVVVDGGYVYFVDIEGPSHFVARIDHAADQPVLERYIPAGGKAAADAPHFGVTLGRLYVTGLPHEGRRAARRLIVRDDDPSFKAVDGAVKKL